MDKLNESENIPKENRVKTFPQIYIDDKRIGGYTDFKQAFKEEASV